MKKSQKLMVTSLLLAVIALCTVGPTLSWLSATTTPVVNTFAGGAIALSLDEALVDTNGNVVEGDGAQRVIANTYRYTAGAVLHKDPTVTILKGSDACYVFLCVENTLPDTFVIDYSDQWVKVAEADGKAVYMYNATVDTLNAEEDVTLTALFTTVTVPEDLTAEDITALGERTLSVTAYALQAQGLTEDSAKALAASYFECTVIAD